MSGRGLFIVLEGIDGSGKTTLRDGICNSLMEKGFEVISTAEPTNGKLGTILRNGGTDNQLAEALLFVADRACHTDEIREQLSNGISVVCDRYYASTLAYQSAGSRGPDYGLLVTLNELATIEPDVTILLDIDPERSMSRVDDRGEEKSKFEKLEFQKRVRENYLSIAMEKGFIILDATASKETLLSQSMEHIMEKQR